MNDLRDFLNWFEGFSENIEKCPNEKQWGKIRERITALRTAPQDTTVFPAGLTYMPRVSSDGAGTKPAEPPRAAVIHPFIIDREGYARNGRTNARVKASDVTDGIFDQRGEDGDLSAIIWADNRRGIDGLDLAISA